MNLHMVFWDVLVFTTSYQPRYIHTGPSSLFPCYCRLSQHIHLWMKEMHGASFSYWLGFLPHYSCWVAVPYSHFLCGYKYFSSIFSLYLFMIILYLASLIRFPLSLVFTILNTSLGLAMLNNQNSFSLFSEVRFSFPLLLLKALVY